MKHLSDREMSLFTLEDFVQVGSTMDTAETVQKAESDVDAQDDLSTETEPLLLAPVPSLNGKTSSTNGHDSDDGN